MENICIDYEGLLRSKLTTTSLKTPLYTDGPLENGGQGVHFSPTDLLAASLGSCIVTVIALAAKRHHKDITSLRATLEKKMSSNPRRISSLTVHLYCPDHFDEATLHLLEQAARHCPVHNSLHPDIEQHFEFHWGQP